MQVHEKIAELRHRKDLTQKQMAKKINMSKEGYGKLGRGERQLRVPRLKQIATALGMELKDFLEVDEKIIFSGRQSGCQNKNFYVNPTKETTPELETLRLLLEQKEREMELLREQVGQLKEQVNQLRLLS